MLRVESTEPLHCPELSTAVQKVEGTSWLWKLIHGNKTWEDVCLTQMWDSTEQQARERYPQSQCQPAEQTNVSLVKEAALVPPLPLPGQSQNVPFWVSLGTRHRNTGNDSKVDRMVRDCSRHVLKWKMFVWDTLLCLENRCKSVLTFKDVLHSSLTPPS